MVTVIGFRIRRLYYECVMSKLKSRARRRRVRISTVDERAVFGQRRHSVWAILVSPAVPYGPIGTRAFPNEKINNLRCDIRPRPLAFRNNVVNVFECVRDNYTSRGVQHGFLFVFFFSGFKVLLRVSVIKKKTHERRR